MSTEQKTMELSLMELKASAYDKIAELEQYQQAARKAQEELVEINRQISNLVNS